MSGTVKNIFALPKNLTNKNPQDYAHMVCNYFSKAYKLLDGGYNLLLTATLNAYQKAAVFGNGIKVNTWDDAVKASEQVTLECVLSEAKAVDEEKGNILEAILLDTEPLIEYDSAMSMIKKEIKDAMSSEDSAFRYKKCSKCQGPVTMSIEQLSYLECGAVNGGYLITYTCQDCGTKTYDVFGITRSGVIRGSLEEKAN